MFSEAFSTGPFLLCSKYGSEKLPEKPCDIQRQTQFPRNSVNILTSTAPGFPHLPTRSGPTVEPKHCSLLAVSTVPCSAFATVTLQDRAQRGGYCQPCVPFPSAALPEAHPTPELTTNPKCPVGALPAPLGALAAHKGFSPKPPCRPNAN